MILDFVTVGFLPDIRLLALQARSIARYLDPAICGRLLVINNDPDQPAFARRFAAEVLPEYGPFRDLVDLVPAEALFGAQEGFWQGSGWRRQQVLKLAAARRIRQPACIVLDCKNHFVRPAGLDTFADRAGRLIVMHRDRNARQTSELRWFGIPEERWPPALFNIVTPFPLWRDEVLALEEAVRARSAGGTGPALLDKALGFGEFRLYCVFLMTCGRNWEALHAMVPDPPFVNYFGRSGTLAPFLRSADRPRIRMLGVHRRTAWTAEEERRAIVDRWLHAGLVADAEEGIAILTPAPGERMPP